MSRVTPHQLSGLASAGVLFTFCGQALADFERETLAGVCERLITLGPEATITEPEWAVCAEAINAMRIHGFAVHELRYETTGGGHPSIVSRGGRA